MFNQVEPDSGNFFQAEYLEYDKSTKKYLPKKYLKLKGSSGIGVSTGVKEVISINEGSRMIQKVTFRVGVNKNYPFKIRDKIVDLTDGEVYTILKVSDDILHPNAMANLMFPHSSNRPKVLNLGTQ
jgi:hypothetical protein